MVKGYVRAAVAMLIDWLLLAALVALCVWWLNGQTKMNGQTKIAPAQIKNGPTFTALACIAPGTANSNCAGLVYVDAFTAAGTEIKIVGVAPDPTFVLDPQKWSVIP